MNPHWPFQRRSDWQPITSDRQSTFEVYLRISPVVVFSERGGRWKVTEHNHATRLLKDLDRIGRDGRRLRGMICDDMGALDRSSIRALNVYLESHGGIHFPKTDQCDLEPVGFHRFGWYALQRLVGLRWVR